VIAAFGPAADRQLLDRRAAKADLPLPTQLLSFNDEHFQAIVSNSFTIFAALQPYNRPPKNNN
jgi:hypothetical protein